MSTLTSTTFNSGVMPAFKSDGIITSTYDNTTNGFNASSSQWANASAYLSSLNSGYYVSNKPLDEDTPDVLRTKYTNIATGLQNEYNHYFTDYKKALELFFGTPAPSPTQQTHMLMYLKESNKRLNALTSLVSVLANQEAARTNTYNGEINTLNTLIKNNISNLTLTQDDITNKDSLLTTRKEMIRFTAEKNNHITNQISMWAALNVLAIGTIFAIYRNM